MVLQDSSCYAANKSIGNSSTKQKAHTAKSVQPRRHMDNPKSCTHYHPHVVASPRTGTRSHMLGYRLIACIHYYRHTAVMHTHLSAITTRRPNCAHLHANMESHIHVLVAVLKYKADDLRYSCTRIKTRWSCTHAYCFSYIVVYLRSLITQYKSVIILKLSMRLGAAGCDGTQIP